MKNFYLFQPGWWVLHIAAIGLMFWVGHVVRF
jgi:hypothetical protein